MVKAVTRALILGACLLASPAQSMESVAPSLLVKTFLDVCPASLKGFFATQVSLVRGGWKIARNEENTHAFTHTLLVSPDENIFAEFQHLDFEPGLFDSCMVFALSEIKQSDSIALLESFPSAKGKLIPGQGEYFSGMWLLADQKEFTSISLRKQKNLASIEMLHTYPSPLAAKNP
jgi:hypothetical protein